jgi:hypothetical protein
LSREEKDKHGVEEEKERERKRRRLTKREKKLAKKNREKSIEVVTRGHIHNTLFSS